LHLVAHYKICQVVSHHFRSIAARTVSIIRTSSENYEFLAIKHIISLSRAATYRLLRESGNRGKGNCDHRSVEEQLLLSRSAPSVCKSIIFWSPPTTAFSLVLVG
jgi:hypothetical protein